MRGRAFLGGAAGSLLVGLLTGGVVLDPEVRASRGGGDWRALSAGLEEAARAPALVGGERALVHVHGLRALGGAVEVKLSLRTPAFPADLTLTHGDKTVFRGRAPRAPAWTRVSIPAGTRDLDLWLQATARTDTPTRRPLYLVHEIRLTVGEPRWRWLGAAGGALLGLVIFVAFWSFDRRREAFPAAALGTAFGISLFAFFLEPALWLRFAPATREALRLGALVVISVWALARAGSRRLAVLAVMATTLVLFLSTLHHGLLDDDFVFARPWSLREVFSTFVGSEDPTGAKPSFLRPLASTSHALDFALYGLEPPAFHLTNVLLRALTAALALVFFARLGLPPLGALAGALVYVAHPLGASAVAWVSQRTDLLVTVFSLGALISLAAPRLTRAQAGFALLLTLLALWSKEMAVTLPLVGFLVVRFVLPPEERPRRLLVVGGMAALVVVYVIGWGLLFPDRAWHRVANPWRWSGFDPGTPSFWLRLLPGLLAPIFLPTDYPHWWRRTLQSWPSAYLLGATLVGPVLLWVVNRGGSRPYARAAALGLVWPVVVVWPLLAVRTLDLYRLGLLLCLGFALLLGAVVARLGERSRSLAIALTIAVVLWLAPKTLSTTAAWGPGGFYWEMVTRWRTYRTPWLESLRSDSRALFFEQVASRHHAERGIAAASTGDEVSP